MGTRLEDARERFLLHLEAERGCSPYTISCYGSDMERFACYLLSQEIPRDPGATATSHVL